MIGFWRKAGVEMHLFWGCCGCKFACAMRELQYAYVTQVVWVTDFDEAWDTKEFLATVKHTSVLHEEWD